MPSITTLSSTPVTIASGGTTSGALDCSSGRTLVGVYLPAALTGTAITFTACATSSGTFTAVYIAGGASAYSATVAASRYVPVDPNVFAGARFVKLVSGSTEAADRDIVCATKVL